jgi:hypothetical protein
MNATLPLVLAPSLACFLLLELSMEVVALAGFSFLFLPF